MRALDIDKIKAKARSGEKNNSGKLKGTVRRARKILRILNRDNFKCVMCGTGTELTIHHPEGRKEFRWDNAQKYNKDKCITLCVKCHKVEHNLL